MAESEKILPGVTATEVISSSDDVSLGGQQDPMGWAKVSKLFEAVEGHQMTAAALISFIGYVTIAATGHMSEQQEFDRYFMFLLGLSTLYLTTSFLRKVTYKNWMKFLEQWKYAIVILVLVLFIWFDHIEDIGNFIEKLGF